MYILKSDITLKLLRRKYFQKYKYLVIYCSPTFSDYEQSFLKSFLKDFIGLELTFYFYDYLYLMINPYSYDLRYIVSHDINIYIENLEKHGDIPRVYYIAEIIRGKLQKELSELSAIEMYKPKILNQFI